MAIVATVDTPICTCNDLNSYQVSVNAHFVDGAIIYPDKICRHTLNNGSNAEQTLAVNDLADQINNWKAVLNKQAGGTALMEAARAAIGAKI